MRGQPPTTYFLWSECSFPEWNCSARNLESVGEGQQAATPCSCLLASSSAFCVVAICPAQCATLLHNSLPVLENGASRLELFSSNQVGCNMKHVHTFACPVFALQNALASGKLLPRWSPHTRLGLNLGPSPTHARNVYLVLKLMTGCVSSQSTVGLMTSLRQHVTADLMFQTPFVGSNSQDFLAHHRFFLILHGIHSPVRCHKLFLWKSGLMIWIISPCPKWILTL